MLDINCATSMIKGVAVQLNCGLLSCALLFQSSVIQNISLYRITCAIVLCSGIPIQCAFHFRVSLAFGGKSHIIEWSKLSYSHCYNAELLLAPEQQMAE